MSDGQSPLLASRMLDFRPRAIRGATLIQSNEWDDDDRHDMNALTSRLGLEFRMIPSGVCGDRAGPIRQSVRVSSVLRSSPRASQPIPISLDVPPQGGGRREPHPAHLASG
jgi:hypothetical protein